MSRFAQELGRTICVDPSMAALPMLSVVGACVGNTARARMSGDFHAPANVWTAIITRSGERKSPVLRAVMRPIYEQQAKAEEQHAQVVADYKLELERWKQRPKNERGDSPCEPPPYPHLFLADVTAEAIALRLRDQPRGLIVALDELSGLFGAMNQYKSGKGNDRESYLAFYDAGVAKVDRKSATPPTLFIPRALVSITGATQPSTLARCLGAAEFDSGMAARFLFASPPPRQAKWTGAEMPDEVRAGWRDLVTSLVEAPLPETPALIPPTEDAMREWVLAHDRFEVARFAEPDDRLRAARSKLIGAIPRLALIFQMASAATGERSASVRAIDGLSMRRAIQVAEWAARETRRVYALLALEAEDGANASGEQRIIRLIEDRGDEISVRGLMQACRMFRSSATRAEEYLNSMVNDGLGRWQYRSTGGRQAKLFVLTSRMGGNTSPLSQAPVGNTTPAGAIADAASVSVTSVTADSNGGGR
jgi:hypothetical protein